MNHSLPYLTQNIKRSQVTSRRAYPACFASPALVTPDLSFVPGWSLSAYTRNVLKSEGCRRSYWPILLLCLLVQVSL